MRIIKTLTDAAQALRDIESKFLGAFDITDKVMDLKKRRLTNVAPSKDENDVVIRKELLQHTPAGPPAQSNNDALVGRCVFGIGINTDIVIASDCVPRHAVTFPLAGGSGKSAKIIKAYANCKQPPVGSSLKVDIIKAFGTPDQVTLYTHETAENDDSSTITTIFDNDSIADNDLITASVTQVGSTVPGSGLYISIRYIWQ